MKTLFLFIPHYVFSSDLLHTPFIKELSEKYKVVVFSPIFKVNPASNYYQSPNVIYVAWETQSPKFWQFLTKTARVSMVREFDHLKYYKLRHSQKINTNWRRNLLRALSWLLPKRLLTVDFFTKIETLLTPNSKIFGKFIQKYQPAAVLTCTPGFNNLEAEAIVLAKKNGLPTAAINSSWDNYTSNAVQFRKTDYLISWNEVMKKEAAKIHHYSEDKLFVSGIYRFDHHFQVSDLVSKNDFLSSKNLDPDRQTLFFSTVPQNTYPHQTKVLKEILKIRNQLNQNNQFNILLRLHPNDSAKNYEEFLGMENFHIELPGKVIQSEDIGRGYKVEMNTEDLSNLRYSLKYTDLNVNFRSSISLEATIYDKPIINLALYGYAQYYQMDHYIPILNSGGIKLVESPEALKEAINLYLKNPALDREGRKKIFDVYIGFKDGLSYKRSVETLAEMV